MKMQPTKENSLNKVLTESIGQASQNFGLTQEEFNTMLKALQAGNETLFERVFLSQFEESRSYLMKKYNISSSQAYDVTMDALLKFRRRLLVGKIKYGNMRFLFTRMASQFLSETFKLREVVIMDMSEEEEEEKLDQSVLDALDRAWKGLGEKCSNVLHKYYYKRIKLKDLAVQLERSEAAIRKQKQRCLEQLRLLFLKYYQE